MSTLEHPASAAMAEHPIVVKCRLCGVAVQEEAGRRHLEVAHWDELGWPAPIATEDGEG